jgi:pantoate--beta-alanine ligase
MRVLTTIADLRAAVGAARRVETTASVGFVPTMGALHEGHLSLIRRARAETGLVVVSIFVNPMQFNDPADLEKYPRPLERDTELAASAGADIVFAPDAAEIYPPGFSTVVSVHGISEPLEGAMRGASHFEGVATVVTKLLNIVQPDAAYFGQKDAQQALLIKHMVRDLAIPVRIEVCPTVREADGLALSSRNVRLDVESRSRALSLSRALRRAQSMVDAGDRDAATIQRASRQEMLDAGIDVEYCDIVSGEDLRPVATDDDAALLAIAARVGGVRLIDNAMLQPAARP